MGHNCRKLKHLCLPRHKRYDNIHPNDALTSDVIIRAILTNDEPVWHTKYYMCMGCMAPCTSCPQEPFLPNWQYGEVADDLSKLKCMLCQDPETTMYTSFVPEVFYNKSIIIERLRMLDQFGHEICTEIREHIRAIVAFIEEDTNNDDDEDNNPDLSRL